MLPNYLKLAVRLLLRNPFFSLINILGLSLGFAAFLVLWQYSSNELKSDQYHSDFKNKARLIFYWTNRDDSGKVTDISPNSNFSAGFPQQLLSQHDDITAYTRIFPQSRFTSDATGDHGKEIFLSYVTPNRERKGFKEENLAYADPNLFTFFEIPFIAGSPEKALIPPNSIVLSRSMAEKYFGTTDVINREMFLNDSITVNVTAVIEDLPHNTHLTFDAVLSTERIAMAFNQRGNGPMYFHIKQNVNRADLDKKIDLAARTFMAVPFARLNIDPNDIDFGLQPLEEIAFTSFRGDSHKLQSKEILTVLSITSIVILITAWVNYLNLIIYANSKRLKELGIRKTSGAVSSDFIIQFLIESAVTNGLAILGAITLVQLTRISMQDYFQIYLTWGGGISLGPILVIVLVTIIGIIVTGVYPALTVMKKETKSMFAEAHVHSFSLGKWLTVFQFSAAIILMVSVFAIYFQVGYILNKDLGFKRDEIVVLDLPEDHTSYSKSTLNTFLTELSKVGGIKDFATSYSVPGDNSQNGIAMRRSAATNIFGTDTNGGVDERFLPFFGIKLIAGRNFVNGDPINDHAIIVSRRVLQRLGIDDPDDAVGEKIHVEAKEWTHDMRQTEIIGVIDDYIRKPMLSGVESWWSNESGIALTYHDNVDAENTPQKISMTMNEGSFDETIKQVENLYRKTFSISFLHWYFLNDNVNQHYRHEKIARNQIMLFAVLAIVIACLGLLGMITNKAKEKTKEIGIRKILGAKVYDIVQILLSTTLSQIAIAALVGIPVAHFLVQGYLQKYSERIELQWWHYALPVVVLLSILLATILSTLRKATKSNPVESLRCE